MLSYGHRFHQRVRSIKPWIENRAGGFREAEAAIGRAGAAGVTDVGIDTSMVMI